MSRQEAKNDENPTTTEGDVRRVLGRLSREEGKEDGKPSTNGTDSYRIFGRFSPRHSKESKNDANLLTAQANPRRVPTTAEQARELLKGKQKALPTDHELMQELGYLPSWPRHRKELARIFNHPAFDLIVSLVVIFNLVIVVVETDFHAKYPDEDTQTWIVTSNVALLVFYTCEMASRMYVFRWNFWDAPTNVFDFIVVSIDLISYPITLIFGSLFSISFLRIFRLVRLTRSAKFAKLSPELSLLMRGLRDTGKTLFWGALMLFFSLTMWSIIAVEFIHPINLELAEDDIYTGCTRCSRAFESVMQSNLTFFQQLLAGDSWGLVTIPIIERRPATAIFFAGVHITVSIGLMNLLLAVIVDRANSARQDDVKTILKESEYQKRKLKAQLLETFTAMDEDNNRKVSFEEMYGAFQTDPTFAMTMKAMAIEEDELHVVFGILDKDQDGEVDYDEFVDQLWKMKSQDSHTLLVFIKYYITEVRQKVIDHVSFLEKDILSGHEAIQKHLSYLFGEVTGSNGSKSQNEPRSSWSDFQKDLRRRLELKRGYNGHGQVIAEIETLPEISPHKLSKQLAWCGNVSLNGQAKNEDAVAIETTPRTKRNQKAPRSPITWTVTTPRSDKQTSTGFTPLYSSTPRVEKETSSVVSSTPREIKDTSIPEASTPQEVKEGVRNAAESNALERQCSPDTFEATSNSTKCSSVFK